MVTIFFVFALVLFILAGIGLPGASYRWNLAAFGLAFLAAAFLIIFHASEASFLGLGR